MDLLVGFYGGFLGLAGGFRGGRAPADFLFSAGGFFRRIFLFILQPKKSTAKIHSKNPPLPWRS